MRQVKFSVVVQVKQRKKTAFLIQKTIARYPQWSFLEWQGAIQSSLTKNVHLCNALFHSMPITVCMLLVYNYSCDPAAQCTRWCDADPL